MIENWADLVGDWKYKAAQYRPISAQSTPIRARPLVWQTLQRRYSSQGHGELKLGFDRLKRKCRNGVFLQNFSALFHLKF